MTSPLGAIIAAIGGGAGSLGQSLDERHKEAIAALVRAQQAKQKEFQDTFPLIDRGFQPTDALKTLAQGTQGAAQGAAGTAAAPVPVGSNPDMGMSAIIARGVAPTLQGNADALSGALTSGPTVTTPGGTSFTQNPLQTPEAVATRRMMTLQAAADQRAEAQRKAAQDLQDSRAADAQAKAQADFQRTEQGAYRVLKASFPNSPVLRASPTYDPSVSYTKALADEQDIRKQNATKPTPDHWMSAGVDPETGKPLILNTSTGKTKLGGGLRGGSGGGGSAQGAQAPLDDMIAQYDRIAGHAKDIAAGTFKFSNTNATRSALGFGQAYAQAEGKPAIGAQVGQQVMDLFGMAPSGSPDQQRYEQLMTATRAMGDDAAKVFKGRQGFQNIALEIAQSTLQPSDIGHPERVNQKLSRLRHIIKLAAIVSPPQAAATDPQNAQRFGFPIAKRGIGPTATSAPSQAQQLWDAAVAKYGQAKVMQDYGPRPNE